MMRLSTVVLAGLGMLLSAPAHAQTQQRDPGIPLNFTPATNLRQQGWETTFFRLPGLSEDYRLGPGDQLEIAIYGLAEAPESVTVSNSGTVSLPLIGTIQAAELTTTELEAAISERLVAEKLIQQPEVLVYVTEYEAKPIYIVGEVDNPGQYIMSQRLTLTEAILIAGGLDYTAEQYGYLHRATSPKGPSAPPSGLTEQPDLAMPGREVIKVDLTPMKRGGVLDPDVPLRGGDVFVVPKRNVQFFYVIGDVTSAGAFEYPPGQPLMVSRAISAAGGPRKTAKMSEGMLVRIEADGRRVEKKADYAAVLEGRAPDFEVKPNDVIFVPGATSKTVAYGLINTVPQIISNLAIYAIIW